MKVPLASVARTSIAHEPVLRAILHDREGTCGFVWVAIVRTKGLSKLAPNDSAHKMAPLGHRRIEEPTHPRPQDIFAKVCVRHSINLHLRGIPLG